MLVNQPCVPATYMTQITSDTTTTSTSFTSLLSLTIDVNDKSTVIVDFTASANNSSASNRTISFRLSIDGTPIRGSAIRTAGSGNSAATALIYQTGTLSAGSHTFLIEWSTSATTAQIRPVATDEEHATLLLYEVTV